MPEKMVKPSPQLGQDRRSGFYSLRERVRQLKAAKSSMEKRREQFSASLLTLLEIKLAKIDLADEESDEMKSDVERATSLLDEILEKSKTPVLFCSFCRISQYEATLLVAAESVFICEGCINLSTDIISEERGIRKIVRSIEFEPSQKQAGTAILSYFARYIE